MGITPPSTPLPDLLSLGQAPTVLSPFCSVAGAQRLLAYSTRWLVEAGVPRIARRRCRLATSLSPAVAPTHSPVEGRPIRPLHALGLDRAPRPCRQPRPSRTSLACGSPRARLRRSGCSGATDRSPSSLLLLMLAFSSIGAAQIPRSTSAARSWPSSSSSGPCLDPRRPARISPWTPPRSSSPTWPATYNDDCRHSPQRPGADGADDTRMIWVEHYDCSDGAPSFSSIHSSTRRSCRSGPESFGLEINVLVS